MKKIIDTILDKCRKKNDKSTEVKQVALRPIVITSLTAGAAVALNILCEQLFHVSISIEAITDFLNSLAE